MHTQVPNIQQKSRNWNTKAIIPSHTHKKEQKVDRLNELGCRHLQLPFHAPDSRLKEKRQTATSTNGLNGKECSKHIIMTAEENDDNNDDKEVEKKSFALYA